VGALVREAGEVGATLVGEAAGGGRQAADGRRFSPTDRGR
jgi:hypothetical protein